MTIERLAVAARFGIGKDFWLNLLLTICGYIPGKVSRTETTSKSLNLTLSRRTRT